MENVEAKTCDTSYMGKVMVFSNNYLKCCKYIINTGGERYIFTKNLYSKLISTSQLLEDFLDFHGAKNNTQWYYYRELSAAVRHLSISGYAQKHILNRLIFYEISELGPFEEEGIANLDFIIECLKKLAPAILEEAQRLQIDIPEDTYSTEDFPGIASSETLEFDIEDEDKDLQKKNIVKIASEFLAVAHSFDEFSFFEPYTTKQLHKIVPAKVNEVEIRRYEMLVHNLQSSFDTYVIHGGYRFGNRKLKQLRGCFSIVFHLLQVIGRLLHFYERHLHETGYKSIDIIAQDKMAELVSPSALLNHTINFGLSFVCKFLSQGKTLATEILNENIERNTINVGIPKELGFHMRPSLLVAKIVQHHGGQVELCIGPDRFDASSVLDIQWAGGKIQKENIEEVNFEGDVRALKDIKILAGVNYGEDSMGKGVPLPTELKYLR